MTLPSTCRNTRKSKHLIAKNQRRCLSFDRGYKPEVMGRDGAVLFLFVMFVMAVRAAGAGEQYLGWLPTEGTCRGSVEECLGMEEMFQMDSETNRRILAAKKYISYSALLRNSVPCSLRGASYYNCRPSARANPYSRGCLAITRCRS